MYLYFSKKRNRRTNNIQLNTNFIEPIGASSTSSSWFLLKETANFSVASTRVLIGQGSRHVGLRWLAFFYFFLFSSTSFSCPSRKNVRAVVVLKKITLYFSAFNGFLALIRIDASRCSLYWFTLNSESIFALSVVSSRFVFFGCVVVVFRWFRPKDSALKAPANQVPAAYSKDVSSKDSWNASIAIRNDRRRRAPWPPLLSVPLCVCACVCSIFLFLCLISFWFCSIYGRDLSTPLSSVGGGINKASVVESFHLEIAHFFRFHATIFV